MYAEWPFFQSTIDLIEMILAKADMRIAELYDRTLVTDPAQRRLGAHLRQHFHNTVNAVLQARSPCAGLLAPSCVQAPPLSAQAPTSALCHRCCFVGTLSKQAHQEPLPLGLHRHGVT